MSERTPVLIEKKSTEEVDQIQERIKLKNEAKAKLVSVLSRGVLIDRQNVDLPPEVYGEWVPNDKTEIYRMEALGFKIDTEYACKRALHEGGEGGPSIIADTVFMTCPSYVKEVIEEIRVENYEAANSPRGGKQKEERDFDNEAATVGLPTQMKSRIDNVNTEDIRAAITAKN